VHIFVLYDEVTTELSHWL